MTRLLAVPRRRRARRRTRRLRLRHLDDKRKRLSQWSLRYYLARVRDDDDHADHATDETPPAVEPEQEPTPLATTTTP